ncbi:glutamate decarboxylase-like [Salvia splendens]|uniref:glutamate decarboxylase-like n=1 Tax=Salvia splendens TaxID=180675 RepID=UPI001C261B50|nr:glutamate decarboxylase-like [Salvia splendens]
MGLPFTSGEEHQCEWPQIRPCRCWLGCLEEPPDDLLFHINYLGSDQPTFTFNFSKGSSQIIAQYYQFIRLGFEGYKSIMENCMKNAMILKEGIAKTGRFDIISKDVGVPVVAFSLKDSTNYTVFQISESLRRFGWIVPAYTMPPNAEHVAVLRIVVREDFSHTLAERLIPDMEKVVKEFDAMPPRATVKEAHVTADDGKRSEKSVVEVQRDVFSYWRKISDKKSSGVC